MAFDLSSCLVVGVSSRSLFNLEAENKIFEEQGRETYIQYQLDHEDEVLEPGTAFSLIKALLALNDRVQDRRLIEVVVMSRNSPDTGLRVLNSIRHYGLDITRAALTGGESLASYLEAFKVDLFLSRSLPDVQTAIDAGFAAAQIYDPPTDYSPDPEKIRIAFDADAVLFSEESERIYKERGIEAFFQNERDNAKKPLPKGPFAKLLKTLSTLQYEIDPNDPPVRVAIVTARNSPAHERVIRTLRSWKVRVDAAFFLGGVTKAEILKAFKAHIFFDDQEVHLGLASTMVPSGRVPYRTGSPLLSAAQPVTGAAVEHEANDPE